MSSCWIVGCWMGHNGTVLNRGFTCFAVSDLEIWGTFTFVSTPFLPLLTSWTRSRSTHGTLFAWASALPLGAPKLSATSATTLLTCCLKWYCGRSANIQLELGWKTTGTMVNRFYVGGFTVIVSIFGVITSTFPCGFSFVETHRTGCPLTKLERSMMFANPWKALQAIWSTERSSCSIGITVFWPNIWADFWYVESWC